MSSEIDRRYPKVLVVTADPIARKTGLGITMCNLFHGWPKNRIAQVTASPNQPDPLICDNFWMINSTDVPLDRIFRGMATRFLSKPASQQNEETVKTDGEYDPSRTNHGINPSTPFKKKLFHFARAYADMLPFKPSPDFWKWISDFQPDVIYGHMGSSRYAQLLTAISRKVSKPLFLHIMDDWISTIHTNSFLTCFPRWSLLNNVKKAYNRSLINGTISQKMAEEYSQRFNCQFVPLLNAVDVPSAPPDYPKLPHGSPMRFIYIGGLHLNRWKSLRDIAQALKLLHEKGINSELVIHAPERDLHQFQKELSVDPIVKMAGSIHPKEMANAVDQSHAVVHIESFDDSMRRYTRLSLSTKIPQYMSRGRPIVAYGPGELASCRHIYDSRAGILIDQQDLKYVQVKLREFIANESFRYKAAQGAWETARDKHNVVNACERFRQLLMQVAESPIHK